MRVEEVLNFDMTSRTNKTGEFNLATVLKSQIHFEIAQHLTKIDQQPD